MTVLLCSTLLQFHRVHKTISIYIHIFIFRIDPSDTPHGNRIIFHRKESLLEVIVVFAWLIREIRHRCYISRNSTSDSRIITFVYVQTSTCRKAVPIFSIFFSYINRVSLCVYSFFSWRTSQRDLVRSNFPKFISDPLRWKITLVSANRDDLRWNRGLVGTCSGKHHFVDEHRSGENESNPTRPAADSPFSLSKFDSKKRHFSLKTKTDLLIDFDFAYKVRNQWDSSKRILMKEYNLNIVISCLIIFI